MNDIDTIIQLLNKTTSVEFTKIRTNDGYTLLIGQSETFATNKQEIILYFTKDGELKRH